MYKSKEKNAEYQRKWYKANKETHFARIKSQQYLKRQYVSILKESYPCTDCGKYFYSCQMQFDHINDNKIQNVSYMSQRGAGWNKLLEEIAKCELVCANCHALRTYNRRPD